MIEKCAGQNSGQALEMLPVRYCFGLALISAEVQPTGGAIQDLFHQLAQISEHEAITTLGPNTNTAFFLSADN